MTNEEFNQIVDETCESIKNVLSKKAAEYASVRDRLHNFKMAAKTMGITPLEALDGMMLKHEISFLDLIDKSKYGAVIPKEIYEEKIGDFINYLILAKGLIVDANKNNSPKMSI